MEHLEISIIIILLSPFKAHSGFFLYDRLRKFVLKHTVEATSGLLALPINLAPLHEQTTTTILKCLTIFSSPTI